MKYVRTLDGQVLVVERNIVGEPTIQVTDTPWRVSDEDAASFAALGATVGVLVIAEDQVDGVPEDAVEALYRQLQATLAATADNAVRAELGAAAAGSVGATTDAVVSGLAADPGSAFSASLTVAYAAVTTPQRVGASADATGDDGPAFQALIDAGDAGATTNIYLPPGSHYRIVTPLVWDDAKGQLNIASGGGPRAAVIEYAGTGDMLVAAMPSGTADLPAYTLSGVEFRGAPGAVFSSFVRSDDVRQASVIGCRFTGTSPTVAAVWVRNVVRWSERFTMRDCVDRGMRRLVYFDASSRTGTGTVSFARAFLDNNSVQGGESGYCKIDISPDASVYDSFLGRVYGNVNGGVRIYKLTGSMGDTRIESPQIEAATGTTAYHYEVGAQSGPRPTRRGNVILRNCAEYVTDPGTTSAVWDAAEFDNGVFVENQVGNQSLDILRRRNSALASPINPAAYVTQSGGAAWPFTEFGNLVIQASAGRDIVLMDSAGGILRGGPASGVTGNFTNAAHALNTRGKVAGKQAWNTSTSRPVWATGATATAPWVYADGATAHTPA